METQPELQNVEKVETKLSKKKYPAESVSNPLTVEGKEMLK
jgi:hypothetical protein